jgi:Ras-related C3 botulinum toxin substrate 1
LTKQYGEFNKDGYLPFVADTFYLNRWFKNVNIQLMIADTVINKDYNKIRNKTNANVQYCIMCYAINNKSSFENIKRIYLQDITTYSPNAKFIVVGKKK